MVLFSHDFLIAHLILIVYAFPFHLFAFVPLKF